MFNRLLLVDNGNGLERNVDAGFGKSCYHLFGIVKIDIPVVSALAPYPGGNIDAGFSERADYHGNAIFLENAFVALEHFGDGFLGLLKV